MSRQFAVRILQPSGRAIVEEVNYFNVTQYVGPLHADKETAQRWIEDNSPINPTEGRVMYGPWSGWASSHGV